VQVITVIKTHGPIGTTASASTVPIETNLRVSSHDLRPVQEWDELSTLYSFK
jgi:hypothetical protein